MDSERFFTRHCRTASDNLIRFNTSIDPRLCRNQHLITDGPYDERDVAWHPDGQRLAFSLEVVEWINGEPEARGMKPGRRVPAGAVNISRSPMRVRALERHGDSLLAKLTAVTRDDHDEFAGEGRGASNRAKNAGIQGVLKFYLAAVLGMGLLGGLGWLVVAGDAAKALQVAISVLVVTL